MGDRAGAVAWAAPVLATVTAGAITLPLWLVIGPLQSALDLGGLTVWVAVPVGAGALVALLVVPAAAWAWTVAVIAGAPRKPVIVATLRTGILLAVPVGLVVDATQLLIDTVWRWHALAVHVLFTVAFAIGIPTLVGCVAARAVAALPQGPPARRTGRDVAVAVAVAVLLGAVLAVPLGWSVEVGMGRRMLRPMFLVMALGAGAGGAVLARCLQRHARGGTGHPSGSVLVTNDTTT